MFSFRTTPIGDQLDKALRDGRVGVFSTQNSWDVSADRYLSDLFRERGNLAARFVPRETELTPGTNHIEFDPEQLQGLSAVVVEIQDVGSRYFNYTRDVLRLMSVLAGMEEAPALYVVDHVNPAGRVVEGTIPVSRIGTVSRWASCAICIITRSAPGSPCTSFLRWQGSPTKSSCPGPSRRPPTSRGCSPA